MTNPRRKQYARIQCALQPDSRIGRLAQDEWDVLRAHLKKVQSGEVELEGYPWPPDAGLLSSSAAGYCCVFSEHRDSDGVWSLVLESLYSE